MDPQPIQSSTPMPSSSAPTPPSASHKPSWMLWVLGILAVAVISSGATYLLLGTKATQQPVVAPKVAVFPSSTPDSTANWKTFKSNYGYTVKYPSTWETHIAAPGAPVEDQVDSGSTRYFSPLKDAQGKHVSIDVYLASTTSLQLQQEVISHFGWNNKKTTNFSLGDINAQKTTGIDNGRQNEVVIFQKRNYIFIMGTTPVELDIFDQMLSTFKFTDQSSAVDTSTWKTYAFSGYSIKAPSDWMQSTSSNPIQLLNYDLSKAPGRDFDPKIDKGMLKVEIFSDQTDSDLQSYVKKNQGNAAQTAVLVNNQSGIRIKNTYPGFIVYTKHPSKNVIYSIAFLLDFDNYQDLANQLLSTFKFL